MKGIKNEIKPQTIIKVRRKEKGAQKAESRNRRLGSQEALVSMPMACALELRKHTSYLR